MNALRQGEEEGEDRPSSRAQSSFFTHMTARFATNSRAGLFLFLAAYAACLAAFLPVQSLWLDEILDLIGVRLPSLAGLRPTFHRTPA